MMLRLTLIAALPLLAAQTLRRAPVVAAWAGHHKTPLGVVCQCGMLVMVLRGIARCGETLSGKAASGMGGAIGPLGWGMLLAAVLAVHLVTLVVGQGLGRVLRLPREDWIAVGFAGSQKTLLLGLGLAISYSGTFGPLAVLPMVAYHVAQLLVDTLIADRLRQSAALCRATECA
jgi:sodium/bile acid cotransporter 7